MGERVGGAAGPRDEGHEGHPGENLLPPITCHLSNEGHKGHPGENILSLFTCHLSTEGHEGHTDDNFLSPSLVTCQMRDMRDIQVISFCPSSPVNC